MIEMLEGRIQHYKQLERECITNIATMLTSPHSNLIKEARPRCPRGGRVVAR